MREQFYHEFLTSISDGVDEGILNYISKQLSHVMDKYEITLKSTDVVPYEVMPACVKTYIVTRKIEGTAMSSLELYKLRLQQFFSMVRKPIGEITTNDIRLFLFAIQEKSKCSDRTLDGMRSIISTFFKWANAEGYIPTNPCVTVKPIKYTCKERGFLTEEELEKLRSSCSNVRDKAIVETLYSTGCRVSELINIHLSDINMKAKEVTLFGKGSKYRKSYINTRAMLAIEDYMKVRESAEDNLFVSSRKPSGKLTKAAIEKIVRELGIKAGIDRRVFPHLLRHSCASLGIQRGMDVVEIQRMLGHEKVETTLIYAKIADESVKSSHKKCIV